MKKIFRRIITLTAVLALGTSLSASAAFAETPASESDWDLTRATVSYTEQGIEINQTEMGTPDKHAIAILKVPFENLDSFEIKFRITMNDYVATGRQANDVWTAVNIMGVPSFFNWRNSETYGYAKDTPGLVTRFLSYDGDLRVITDVYQEGFKTAIDDPSSPVVDTWTCIKSSAGVSVEKDVTLKFVWESSSKNADAKFYSMYINGKKISASDELASIDRSVMFPANKLYLTVVMNTQDKSTNSLSKVVIKEINGNSLAKTDSSSADTGSSEDEKSGCSSFVSASSAVFAVIAFGACAFVLAKNKREE